jgi:hypothetical protein
LFWCPYGNERTTTHNTLQNTIVAIALENGAHVEKAISHFFPCHIHNEWIFLSLKMAFEL